MSSDLREPFARDLAEVRALRPKWEGLHSFNEVWEACIAVGLEPEIAEGSRTYSTRSGVARRAARVMRAAHPINFGSAQLSAVHGLCLNDGANPFEFLREHRDLHGLVPLLGGTVDPGEFHLPSLRDEDPEDGCMGVVRHRCTSCRDITVRE